MPRDLAGLDRPDEPHELRDAQALGLALERRPLGAVADDGEGEIVAARRQEGRGLDREMDALLRR